MKVALVFDGLGYGGIERVGINYAQLFENLGYEVDIYNLKPSENRMEKEFNEKYRIYHYNFPLYLVPDYYMLAVKRWSWAKYLYPWIYIICSWGLWIYRLLTRNNKKYDIVIAFAGHFRDLAFVAYDFLKTKYKMCWLHGSLMEYLGMSCTYGDLYRKIKNLCVLSEERQEITLTIHKYLKDKLNINKIYNPIKLENKEIDKEFCKLLEEKYGAYILMVGRFEKDKDQKTVINAYAILKEKYGVQNKLLFVGDGSTLEECQLYAKKLGMTEDVVFIGARQDVENFYSKAYLFVHSSRAEGLPTVLLEAMLYKVPIVATDSPPGVSEILRNDKYGLRCVVADPEDMAEKINMLLNDEKLRDKFIGSGSERIEDFNFDTIQNQLKMIIDEF